MFRAVIYDLANVLVITLFLLDIVTIVFIVCVNDIVITDNGHQGIYELKVYLSSYYERTRHFSMYSWDKSCSICKGSIILSTVMSYSFKETNLLCIKPGVLQ